MQLQVFILFFIPAGQCRASFKKAEGLAKLTDFLSTQVSMREREREKVYMYLHLKVHIYTHFYLLYYNCIGMG